MGRTVTNQRASIGIGNRLRAAAGRAVEDLERRWLLAGIRGTVFQDSNADGVRQTGEPLQGGVTVFLDANRDGQLTAGETTRVSNASGYYEFTGLTSGLYSVGQVVPVDARQTTPNARSVPVRVEDAGVATVSTASYSHVFDISADGRYVLYQTDDPDILPGVDKSRFRDLYLKDLQTGDVRRINSAVGGRMANGDPYEAHFSGDGKFVGFSSNATNIVAGDTNAATDVFVYDVAAGTLEIVSRRTDGGQANAQSYTPTLSADGRYVAFSSRASNLTATDLNDDYDVFVRDRQTNTTRCVSMNSAGGTGSAFSHSPTISTDGRVVAFFSYARDLAPNDTSTKGQLYASDLTTGQTERVSVGPAGAGSNGTSSDFSPTLSADGRYVAFVTNASNLVAGDTNDLTDAFVFDRQTHTTQRVSLDSDGNESAGEVTAGQISADGRYVTFSTTAALVAADVDDTDDVYVYDRQSHGVVRALPSATAGEPAFGRSAGLSADGRYVVVETATQSNHAYIVPNGHVSSFNTQTVYATDVVVADAVPFGVFKFPTAAGVVFDDANKSGVRDAGEAALSGATVFADLDGDTTRDPAEPFAVTDAAGAYRFTVTQPGSFTVRVTPPAGYYQTGPLAAATGFATRNTAFPPSVPGAFYYNLLAPIALSGDGHSIAYDTYDHLYVEGSSPLPDTELFSALGGSAYYNHGTVSLSSDGRCVAFQANQSPSPEFASNGSSEEIYVYDFDTKTYSKPTLGLGSEGDPTGEAFNAQISGDGRFVAYESSSYDLLPGDTNGTVDIFLHDRQLRTTRRINLTAAGAQTRSTAIKLGGISADGRYIAYTASAGTIVAGDTNNAIDVFVFDRVTGKSDRISVSSLGAQANAASRYARLSPDGRYVAFASTASNLVPGDTNGVEDTFVYDRDQKTIRRVSVDAQGRQTAMASYPGSISGDGRFVSLVANTNAFAGVGATAAGTQSVFVLDRRTGVADLKVTIPAHVGSFTPPEIEIRPALSADGSVLAVRYPVETANGTSEPDYAWQTKVGATGGQAVPVGRTLTLTGGGQATGVDFGAARGTLVSGQVFVDRNTDTLRNAGEEGIAAALVEIYRDDGNGVFDAAVDQYVTAARTDADGQFNQADLPAGVYWLQSVATPATTGKLATGATVRSVTVVAGQPAAAVSFGYVTPITVSTLVDEKDADRSAGDLSLREALEIAAADPGLNIIDFSAAFAGGTLSLQSALGQVSIDNDVIVRGPSAGAVVIDAAAQSRAVYIAPGVAATLSYLTIRNGRTTTGAGIYAAENSVVTLDHATIENGVATGRGGGLYAGAGTAVTLVDSTVRGNVSNDAGGGIASDGALTLVNTTVSGNAATAAGTRGRGGGIYVGGGALVGKNVTVYGNTATFRGGGVYAADGAVRLTNATVAANVADSDRDGAGGGGGLFADLAGLFLDNTVVAANLRGAAAADDVVGAVDASGVSNFIGAGDGSSGLVNAANGNRVGTATTPLDPRLRPLGAYGGPTLTAVPQVDSPLIDTASAAVVAARGLTVDQRGLGRTVAYLSGTAVPDIGAVETAAVITVNATNDQTVDTDSKTSLREALALAAARPGLDVIRFAATASGGTIGVLASLGELVIGSDVDLQGPAGGVTLDGAYATRVLRVAAGAAASIGNLTIDRGVAAAGGGIDNAGTLTLSGVLVTDSRATAGDGGGVRNSGTLTAVNTTLAGNTATGGGAGVANTGTLRLINVTVSGNRADADADSTGRGAVTNTGGVATLQNTVVSGKRRGGAARTLADDVSGAFDATSGFDFIGAVDGSTGLTGAGTQYGTAAAPADAKLVALASNGGPTKTFAVQPGSPLTDAGSNAFAQTAGLTLDARGLPRFRDGTDGRADRVDIGAFEQQTPLNLAPTLSSIATIGGAVENTPFHLSYEQLKQASDAVDPEGAALSFRIESILSGTFTLGDGTPVVAGQTLVAAGQELIWTPPTVAFGTDRSKILSALTVRAFDGQVASVGVATASIEITTVAEPVNYVVLFSGGDKQDLNYPIYYENLKRMYEVVTTQYGVRPADVYVVYADGRDPGLDQRGGINSDMRFAQNVLPATRANLRQTLVNLSTKVDGNDHLMVWTFDHGLGTTAKPDVRDEEVLRGWGNETINDEEFKVWLQGLAVGDSASAFGVPAGYSGIHAGYTTYDFAQCFAGGMLDNLTLSPTVFGAASSNHYEASYADYFASAFTDALAQGYNNTQLAFAYAFGHDGRAATGPANGGAWSFNVEHPWANTGSFPIFATGRDQNAVPAIDNVTPLKIAAGAPSLEITYDMLVAATGATDPNGQALSFRFTEVSAGQLLRGGVPVTLTNFAQSTVSYGQSVTWKPPAGASGVLSALKIQLVGADATTSAPAVLPIRIGDPASGVVAVNDAKSVQGGSALTLIEPLLNDLRVGTGRVVRVGQPLHGTVALDAATGQVRYTPAAEYLGADAFSYVVRDAAGNTDLATVTLSVVPYDPASQGQFSSHFRLTELAPPPGYAGLPTDWSWAYRQTVPNWTTTTAVDISEDGTLLVKTSRPNPGNGALDYVGSTNSTYRWQSGDVEPYWNASADGSLLATNSLLLLLAATDPDTGAPLVHAGRQIYDGIEATSIRGPGVTPNIRYLDPDNANEAGFPPVGGIYYDVGTSTEFWQQVPDTDLLPVDSLSLPTNAGGTYLVALNDTGATTGSPMHARLYQYVNGTPTRIDNNAMNGTGGSGRSHANALGNAGQVAGWAEYAPNHFHGYVYAGGTMRMLGAVGGYSESNALAVNKSGVAVGFSSATLGLPQSGLATTWDAAGTAATLPSLGGSGWGIAYDINAAGIAVGASNGKAVLWASGQVYNLNSPDLLDNLPAGVVLTEAHGINDKGQLAVTGTRNGVNRAYFLDLASDIALKPDSVETSSRRPVSFTPLANDTGAVTVSSVDTSSLQGTLTWSADGQMTYDPGTAFINLPAGQTRQTGFTYTARDGLGGTKTAAVTITVKALGTFYVTDWHATSSGFATSLSAPLVTSQLNVYDGQDAGVDLSDVVLSGATTGAVRGSAHWDAATNTLSFVKTGGPLAADTYTLTLAGRADGVTHATLGALDGNADDTAGGDFVRTFTVAAAASARTLSLPDFARGPGQAVDTVATTVGSALPINISDASGLTSVAFTIRYDPALLNVSAIALDSTMPAGWQAQVNLQTPGVAIVGLYGTTPLPAGARTLVRLTASVPNGAPYRAGGLLSLEGVALNEGLVAAVGDIAVQKVAYLGDATGNGTYSGLDAALVARVAVALDNGLDAYANTDPTILIDTTANGQVSVQDASDVARRAALLDVPNIPALPANPPTLIVSGVDPTVTVAPLTLAAGASGDVSLSIDNAAGLQAFDLTVRYDPARLDALTAAAGTLLGAGWTITTNVMAGGLVVISGYSTTPLPAGVGGGQLLKLAVKSKGPAGAAALDLEGSLNEGGLTLTAVDGAVTVTGGTPTAVQSVQIDDGLVQWNRVRTATIVLNGAVTAAGIGAGAFSLTQISGTVQAYAVNVVSVTAIAGGKTSVVLGFAGPGLTGGSLADGRYTLAIDGSRITDAAGLAVDAAGTGTAGSTRSLPILRLLGDANGDGTVNFNDFLLLQAAFNATTGQPAFRPSTDNNNDGVVNFNDFLVLQAQFNKTV